MRIFGREVIGMVGVGADRKQPAAQRRIHPNMLRAWIRTSRILPKSGSIDLQRDPPPNHFAEKRHNRIVVTRGIERSKNRHPASFGILQVTYDVD